MTVQTYEAFLHNWANVVTVESAFTAAVREAPATFAEDRVGRSQRPLRAITFTWLAISRAESARIRTALARAALAGDTIAPIYSDAAVTTATSSGTTIHCPTADRRFAVGGMVTIVERVGGRPTNPQHVAIVALDASSLTLAEALTGSYPAGSIAIPALRCNPIASASTRPLTDGLVEMRLTLVEAPWSAGVTPLQVVGANPTGWPTHAGWPVLDAGPNWADNVAFGMSRPRSIEVMRPGVESYQDPLGERPRWTVEFTRLARTRADAFALIRFHESRGGRLLPWWIVDPVTRWTLADLTTGYMDVVAGEDLDAEVATVKYAAVVMRDGTIYIRAISAIAVDGLNWRIGFSDSLPSLSAADVARVTPAFLVRFQNDSLVEEWTTSEVCNLRVAAIEVHDEAAEGLIAAGLASKQSRFLYLFESDSGEVMRITDWAEDVTYDGDTYTAAVEVAIDLPTNAGDLDARPAKIAISQWIDAVVGTQVLTSLCGGEPSAPLYVTVYQQLVPLTDDPLVTSETLVTDVVLLGARVRRARKRDQVLELEAVSPKAELEVPLGAPATVGCDWQIFDTNCGLARGDYEETGTVDSIDSADGKTVTLSGLTSPPTAPGGTPGRWWRRGYLELDGLKLPIREWDPDDPTTFHLTRRCPALWEGEDVTVVPGCDKSHESCVEQWDNEERFWGLGYAMPDYYPPYETPGA